MFKFSGWCAKVLKLCTKIGLLNEVLQKVDGEGGEGKGLGNGKRGLCLGGTNSSSLKLGLESLRNNKFQPSLYEPIFSLQAAIIPKKPGFFSRLLKTDDESKRCFFYGDLSTC